MRYLSISTDALRTCGVWDMFICDENRYDSIGMSEKLKKIPNRNIRWRYNTETQDIKYFIVREDDPLFAFCGTMGFWWTPKRNILNSLDDLIKQLPL